MGTTNDLIIVINKVDEIVKRLEPDAGVLRLSHDKALDELLHLSRYGNATLIEALSRSLIIEHMRHMYRDDAPSCGPLSARKDIDNG
jgi:Mg/Co/Ni transporter MgtE